MDAVAVNDQLHAMFDTRVVKFAESIASNGGDTAFKWSALMMTFIEEADPLDSRFPLVANLMGSLAAAVIRLGGCLSDPAVGEDS